MEYNGFPPKTFLKSSFTFMYKHERSIIILIVFAVVYLLFGGLDYETFKHCKFTNDCGTPKVIFYHLALIRNYKQRHEHMMESLYDSKLLYYCEHFYVVVVGNRTKNPIPLLPRQAEIIDGGTDVEKFEWPTINQVYQYSLRRNDTYILYLHDKGATHDLHDVNVGDWIELLLFFTLRHWRASTKHLEKYQIVCPNFSLVSGNPHCSGNFWWARSDYVRTLNVPLPDQQRHFYEMWIGKKLPPALLEFKNVNHTNEACVIWPERVIHYHSREPPETYNNITNPECIYTYPACIEHKCRVPPDIHF